MKKILISIAIIAGLAMALPASAQISVGVSANIGIQPPWGPTGYSYAEYYYIPAIDAFYWVPEGEFVYLDDGEWVFSDYLPPMYADFDLYNCYKVVINTPQPWLNYRYYAGHYARFRDYHGQPVLRGRFAPSRYDNQRVAPAPRQAQGSYVAPRQEAPRPAAQPRMVAPAPRQPVAPRTFPQGRSGGGGGGGHRGR